MSKVIVVTSGKGGVGKTTATANIGSGLARAGKKVVLIDADIGLRNLDLVMGLENRIVFDLVDVIEGRCRTFKQALIRDKRFPELYLLPAAQSKNKDAVQPEQMAEICRQLKEEYDFIIIDCPAGIEHGFKNAIAGADEAIIVTNPEVSAVRDADRIVGLLESEDRFSTHLLVNRIKMELVRKGKMLNIQDIQEILNIALLGIIPEDERILNASNKGEPAILDANSRAGLAYGKVVDRLLDPTIPWDTHSNNGGLWGALKRFFTGARA